MRAEKDPDVAWVEGLAHTSSARAQRAVEEAVAERRLFAHLSRAHREGGRRSYVEIDAPLELYALARLLRPRHTLEVGVSSGVSSAYLLCALRRNGVGLLHSVDRPLRERADRGGRSTGASWAIPPGRASGWAVPASLRGRWDLRIGDKRAVLPRLAGELPSLGLFVYDVPHDDRGSRAEFRELDPLFPEGAVAIADHGPGGGLCAALADWARSRGAVPTGRRGLGLYGFRFGPRSRPRLGAAPLPR